MPKINRKKIVVIVGPTASGKSDLAIKIAQKFDGKIVSADSRQVYKGMDIGTGKVTKKEQRLVKHHLLDVTNPKKVFTVSDFKKLGEEAIDDIVSHHHMPIVVGGTGFYIDALIRNVAVPEVPPNKKLRAQFDKLTAEHLFKMLRKLDPERAKTIDPKNKRRLVRALEIILTTGRPVPKLESSIKYQVLWLGIRPKDLNIKIKKRLDIRLKQGMVQEVKNLLKSGVSKKRLYDFGLEYRQISEYLASKKFKVKSLKNFKESGFYQKLLREIIKYSKRQMTWFKRNKEIHWINPPAGGQKEAEKLIRKFISPL